MRRFITNSASALLLALALLACDHHPSPTAQAPAALPPATNTKCPVSGDDANPNDPKAPHVVYKGKTYVLCCDDCIKDFNANPAKYVKAE